MNDAIREACRVSEKPLQCSRWYFLQRHQYWSDVISIIPHEENNIDLQLELLADF
jgi:hypothetical protein